MKAIILAAGEGKRMRLDRPKVLHEICGKPMLSCVIDAVSDAGACEIIIVVGRRAAEVQAIIGDADCIKYAEQREQLGQGHAVMSARGFISATDEVLVVYGDTPLITAECLSGLREQHAEQNNAVTVVSAVLNDPTGYGRVVCAADGRLSRIVEHKDADANILAINEINAGIYLFNGEPLLRALDNLNRDNAMGEYYLTDIPKIIADDGFRAGVYQSGDSTQHYGVNDYAQLAEAARLMRGRINTAHMSAGVRIIDPELTYIDSDVKIGSGTVVYPGAILEGACEIGENCVIGANSRLVNSVLREGVEVWYSVVTDATVGVFTKVGPFAYLRPNSVIGSNVRIGDFVEIKNSNIGDGTKISHLTYVGDADVGSGVNFGCGTVIVNYDGKIKHRTNIGDNAFIGCNTNLIAPITVGTGAYTAAGATITEDVPEYCLAIARARQVNLSGRAERYTKKD